MLNLPQVTLCCVDTRLPDMALRAMKHCMALACFGEAILFTRPDHGLQDAPPGLRIVALNHITSIEAYSHFMIKGMGSHCRTSHILIVQWDGYVLDPSMWQDEFLGVDYIGAVWPQYSDRHRVGNGGFSLRSRRLLEALQSDEIVPAHPEDVCIARTYRGLLEQHWNIRFANENLARRFAFEREPASPSFGFHGLSNMADILPAQDLDAFVRTAPTELFTTLEARGFIKRLLKSGQKSTAKMALDKRMARRHFSWSDLRLQLRLLIS